MGSNSSKPAVCAQPGSTASNFMGNIFVKSAPVPNRRISMGNNFRQISSCAQTLCQATGTTINGAMRLRFHTKKRRRSFCAHAQEAPAEPPHMSKRRRSICPPAFYHSVFNCSISYRYILTCYFPLSRRSPCPTQRSCSCAHRCRRCTHSRHGGTPHRRSHGRRRNPSRT